MNPSPCTPSSTPEFPSPTEPAPSADPFLCLDLETGKSERLALRELGAWRSDTGHSLHLGGKHPTLVPQLNALTAGAQVLLGHNIDAFDRPILKALHPQLALHQLPMVDTLTLSPIAFPQNPYHRLVKDYKLCTTRRNDPVRDAQLAYTLFTEQRQALQQHITEHPEEGECLHFLLGTAGTTEDAATPHTAHRGLGAMLSAWRGKPVPDLLEAKLAWLRTTNGKVCNAAQQRVLTEWLPQPAWRLPLAYVLSWLRVAGGNSVLPPWVGIQHPRTREAIRALRDTPCTDPTCRWCQEHHQLDVLLPRFFPGITSFRATPTTPQGTSLQQAIVENGMAGIPSLAILPTGGGKSLCYQLPALAHFFRSGGLTVVISPLQSLMKDQVDNLMARGITCSGYLNSMLTPLERRATLDKLRLGDLGLIFVAPEQFRSTAFTKALAHREVRAWVFDEAHCLSKWGHDFRPDYLYVSRFIRQRQSPNAPPSPVFCFTATAKPDVVKDICEHFAEHLDMQLQRLEGGVERSNLHYEVHAVPTASKYAAALRLLQDSLQAGGGAIVFCARQKTVEEVSEFLQTAGLRCAHFHGGMPSEEKRDVQERFIAGHLDVIAATNAFGMGVDKPDVRLVIHLDTPGSLENYLQEAGRAGRDQAAARCVLLYDDTDLDVQFRLLKNARLTQGDIQSILRALRAIKQQDRSDDEVVASTGEILRHAPQQQRIDPDARDADTKVRIAIAWLEEARILERHENHTRVFPGSLLVSDLEDARAQLQRKAGPGVSIQPYLTVLSALMQAGDDESLSTDELMTLTGQDARTVTAYLRDLDRWKLVSNDTELGVLFYKEPPTTDRLQELQRLEDALMARLREEAPDADQQAWQVLNTRSLCDTLRRDTQLDIDPQRLSRLLKSFSEPFGDSGEHTQRSFFAMRPNGHDLRYIRLQRSWRDIDNIRSRRMQVAQVLVAHLQQLRKHNALLITAKQSDIEAALQADAALASLQMSQWDKALAAALLYLDANEVLHLARGKAVFRSAMRIQLNPEASQRRFSRSDYVQLALHYQDKTAQIHVMAEYARLALHKVQEAMRFILDYFHLNWQDFVQRHFAHRKDVLQLATTEQAHRRILTDLANPEQQRIVAAKPEDGSQLVLAGPGAGKTRIIVHRVAWLLRECMVQPDEIMVLTYNRSAATEVRSRLWSLVGPDAAGVTVQTLHSLAMRLTGTSYAVALARGEEQINFNDVIHQATALLRQASSPTEEGIDTTIARDKLLAGLRFVLVDEYQDINGAHYDLISALAGRSLHTAERLHLMAVGDDDQNIYAFDGADVRFIRQFEADYQAQRFSLLENYRCSAHIIDGANRVIAPARHRMKAQQQLRINHARRNQPPGGEWHERDPLTQGRIHILEVPADSLQEATLALRELQRLYALRFHTQAHSSGRWGHFAVIARRRNDLDVWAQLCRQAQIPVQRLDGALPISLASSREGHRLLELLRNTHRHTPRKRVVLRAGSLARWFAHCFGLRTDDWIAHPYLAALAQLITETQAAAPGCELVVDDVIESLFEFNPNGHSSSAPRANAPLLLMTAHRAKGLEFDHVLIADANGWKSTDDEERRLFYVAMTRAKQTLTVCECSHQRHPFTPSLGSLALRSAMPAAHPRPAQSMPLRRSYHATLSDIYLSWLGRLRAPAATHHAIAALRVGDALQLRPRSDLRPGWELATPSGHTIGRMSQQFQPPAHELIAVRVAAIQVRHAKADEHDLVSPRWELVLPEFEYSVDIPVAV